MNQARGPRNTKEVILKNNEECVLCCSLFVASVGSESDRLFLE